MLRTYQGFKKTRTKNKNMTFTFNFKNVSIKRIASVLNTVVFTE